jgi:hypothetical protein
MEYSNHTNCDNSNPLSGDLGSHIPGLQSRLVVVTYSSPTTTWKWTAGVHRDWRHWAKLEIGIGAVYPTHPAYLPHYQWIDTNAGFISVPLPSPSAAQVPIQDRDATMSRDCKKGDNPVTQTEAEAPTRGDLVSVDNTGLRRIPDRIPWVVLLVIIVELGERFTYFGLSGPLQNYIK